MSVSANALCFWGHSGPETLQVTKPLFARSFVSDEKTKLNAFFLSECRRILPLSANSSWRQYFEAEWQLCEFFTRKCIYFEPWCTLRIYDWDLPQWNNIRYWGSGAGKGSFQPMHWVLLHTNELHLSSLKLQFKLFESWGLNLDSFFNPCRVCLHSSEKHLSS